MYEIPTQTKGSLGITHLSDRRPLSIPNNLSEGQDFFFCEGLKIDVQRFMVHYLVCQKNKVETIKTLFILQPLNIPSYHWEALSMDFIRGLPK